MKAHQAGKEVKQEPLPSGVCCMCRKPLIAPWGRNGLNGTDWVCGSTCQKDYDSKYRKWLPQ